MSKNNPLKRTLTLDLNATTNSKKARVQQLQQNHILTSPDVQMLKLTSPELADFLTRNPSLATPTPSGFVFPKTVTEEQEMYAKGFEEALKNMHSVGPTGQPEMELSGGHLVVVTTSSGVPVTIAPSTSSAIQTIEKATTAFRKSQLLRPQLPSIPSMVYPPPPPMVYHPPPSTIQAPFSATAVTNDLSRPSSGASGSIDSSAGSPFDQIRIKEEMDDLDTSSSCSSNKRSRRKTSVSSSNGLMSPINLESQEKIKLERKRLRNRMAASKCRKRKLERIAQLDNKVSDLKTENAELATVVKKLKDAVCNLKQEIVEHVKSGCQINPPQYLELKETNRNLQA